MACVRDATCFGEVCCSAGQHAHAHAQPSPLTLQTASCQRRADVVSAVRPLLQNTQAPNFLLAAPTLLLSLWGPLAYVCANPHHMLTGGLLPRPLLLRLFSSRARAAGNGSNSGCTAVISNGTAAALHGGKGCTGATQQHQQKRTRVRGCSRLVWLIPGYLQHRSGASRGASGGGANGACAGRPATIPGVAYQSLRQRQQEVAAARQQQQQGQAPALAQQPRRTSVEAVYSWHQQQQLQQQARLASGGGAAVRPPHWSSAGGAATASRAVSVAAAPATDGLAAQCSCTTGGAFYRPDAAVFVVHWALLAAVCLAVVHIQVSTRFLSSCAPLYWFAALLMLQRGGGVLRWLLWWYCWAFMGVGAVFFTNFYPWT